MKTIKWKTLFITCAVCLLPIIPCLILWDKLPDQMAIHFNINNVADNFAPKWVVVFLLPVFMVAGQIVCCVANDINAKKHGRHSKLDRVTKWIVPTMSIILQAVTVAYALEYKTDIRRIAVCLVGLILIVIGNYMPKLDYIKNKDVPTDKARKINRFMGFATVIMGLGAIVTVFFAPVVTLVWLFTLIPYALICAIYGIKHGKRG